MPVEASNPAIVPPQEREVFDTWRCADLKFSWLDPSGLASAVMLMRKCRIDEDGHFWDAPSIVDGLRTERLVGTPDVFSTAALISSLGMALPLLVQVGKQLAEEQEAEELASQANQ